MDMLRRLNSVTDLIFSINYLFLINRDLINYPNYGCVNFHGSLLPKYRGRTPHVWAIIDGETETGITAHFMTNEVDEGKIVKQIKVLIEENDTGFSVLAKFNVLYPTIINEVLSDIEQGKINAQEQECSKATYFGKRTPEDGMIQWDWQKEQIRNWVRAQAEPYPGAFTFYNNDKIIINKVQSSDYGFCYT